MPNQLDFANGELRSRPMGPREQIVNYLGRLFGDNREGTARAESITNALEMATPLGMVTGAYDTGNALAKAGAAPSLRSVASAGMTAATMLPFIKGARGAVGDVERGIAREMPMLKDPWGKPQVEPKGILAYHGSPAEFDRFSDEFIGTGEGAQAYGMGHYTAGNEQVAQDYRKKLSGSSKVSFGGVDYLPFNTHAHGGQPFPDSPPGREALIASIVDQGVDEHSAKIITNELQDKGGNVGRANQYLKRVFPVESPVRKVLDAMEEKKPGHTYEVGIHADPEHMLDWDAPIHEQPKSVRDLVEQLGKAPKATPGPFALAEFAPETGGDVYNKLGRSYGRSQEATRRLQEAGVPGIKYLDQGSRDAGEGSRNYVVFDPQMMSILRKYGILPFVGGAAASGGQDDQPVMPPGYGGS